MVKMFQKPFVYFFKNLIHLQNQIKMEVYSVTLRFHMRINTVIAPIDERKILVALVSFLNLLKSS